MIVCFEGMIGLLFDIDSILMSADKQIVTDAPLFNEINTITLNEYTKKTKLYNPAINYYVGMRHTSSEGI